MSDFEPVFLPPGAELDPARGVSMTFLRHLDLCPRSAFLYRSYRNAPNRTVKMQRGRVFHRILELATAEAIAQGEEQIPGDVVKAIVLEELAASPLPVDEHDYVREAAYRWAGEWRLRPGERVVSNERSFTLELAGWKVRCRIDFATTDDAGWAYVADYKSGRGAPPYDEISRKRPDGTLSGKAFQLIVYVLALAFGVPEQDCARCHGDGEIATLVTRDPQDEIPERCPECGGAGVIAGETVARGCPGAIAEFVYPGIEDSEGLMLRRKADLTRLELLEYRESLEATLSGLSGRIAAGDWPAMSSDAGCGICTAPSKCPIPEELRDYAGTINSDEQAIEALKRRHVVSVQQRGLGRELSTYLRKTRGGRPLVYGKRIAEIVPRSSTEIKDKDGLIQALAGGMPPVEARDKFVRVSNGTSFAERDLTSEEIERLEAEHGGQQRSAGGDGAGRGSETDEGAGGDGVRGADAGGGGVVGSRDGDGAGAVAPADGDSRGAGGG